MREGERKNDIEGRKRERGKRELKEGKKKGKEGTGINHRQVWSIKLSSCI